MAEVVDLPRGGSLLHYRPWQGRVDVDDRRGVLLFVAGQALLLTVLLGVNYLIELNRDRLPGEESPAGVLSYLGPLRWLRLVLAVTSLALWAFVGRLRAWPIARVSLLMIFRRKLFWAIYALALTVFLMFFFGQYLMSWAALQVGQQEVRVGGLGRANPEWIVRFLRNQLMLNGSAQTFRNLFWFEGYSVMIVLALAGSVLIGNDIRHGSLAFYLAKPISRWDYLLGKGLAVSVFINLMTTGPALVLFVQYALLEDWDNFLVDGHLLVGIIGYGLIVTVSMTSVLLATATWLRKTVPLIMTWTTLFFFCRVLSATLVNNLEFDPRWRLIDLWNGAMHLGQRCLGLGATQVYPSPQPAWYEAALVLGVVSAACLSYVALRVRGVEIVR